MIETLCGWIRSQGDHPRLTPSLGIARTSQTDAAWSTNFLLFVPHCQQILKDYYYFRESTCDIDLFHLSMAQVHLSDWSEIVIPTAHASHLARSSFRRLHVFSSGGKIELA